MPSPIQAPGGFVPQEATSFAATDGTAQTVSAATPLPVMSPATGYVDLSIAALSTAQAAATSPTLAANPARRAVMLNPPADCTLLIAPASGAARGWPLYANVPNVISAPDVPAAALYVAGLAAGQSVAIWEG